MTIQADVEVPIARPIDAVWDELSALERFPEWLFESGITRVERLDEGPLGEGSRLRIEQRQGGQVSTLEGRVTAWQPPNRLALEARRPDGISLEAEARLTEDGPVTIVRWSLRIGLPMRLRLFESMAAPEVRRAATADLVSLKRRLEQVAS